MDVAHIDTSSKDAHWRQFWDRITIPGDIYGLVGVAALLVGIVVDAADWILGTLVVVMVVGLALSLMDRFLNWRRSRDPVHQFRGFYDQIVACRDLCTATQRADAIGEPEAPGTWHALINAYVALVVEFQPLGVDLPMLPSGEPDKSVRQLPTLEVMLTVLASFAAGGRLDEARKEDWQGLWDE